MYVTSTNASVLYFQIWSYVYYLTIFLFSRSPSFTVLTTLLSLTLAPSLSGVYSYQSLFFLNFFLKRNSDMPKSIIKDYLKNTYAPIIC